MAEGNGVSAVVQTPKEIAAVARPAPAAPKYFQLIPKDLSEAMKFAEMVASSDFVPKGYVGKTGNCLIAMQFGAELGLPPLQAIQNIAVINGKPGIYGDLGKALLYSKGFKIEERDAKETQAKGEAYCKITRPDGSVTERTFSLDNAKTAKLSGKEGPWTNYPYRMMAWRAFWWAARDAAADVLKGIWGIEELNDYKTDAVDASIVDAPREVAPPVIVAVEEPTPANPVVDIEQPTQPNEPPKNGLTAEQRKHVVALMDKFKVTPAELRAYLLKRYGIKEEKRPTAFVTQDQYADVCAWVEQPQDDLDINV